MNFKTNNAFLERSPPPGRYPVDFRDGILKQIVGRHVKRQASIDAACQKHKTRRDYP
jgi:hypothetical protein